MLRILITVIFSACAFAVLACSSTTTTTNVVNNNATVVRATNESLPSLLPTATVDELASGRNVYQASCANCHKENGTGGKVTIDGNKLDAEDLTSAKIKGWTDEKMIRVIMNGIEDDGMPAFKGKLSEGEMRDVVKFIRVELQKMPAPASLKHS
jgi:mono/diheme cytochrome c family protein